MVNENLAKKINVAATCKTTRALGPGLRAVVWVQGCPFMCNGCISPEWRTQESVRLYTPEELAVELLSDARVEGITISGGEPFLQAEGLSEMLGFIRSKKDVNVICFSGYRFEDLIIDSKRDMFIRMMRKIDLLIDGPYIKKLDTGIGLRGSLNQRFLFLNNKLNGFDFENCDRKNEIQIQDGEILQIGIPRGEMNFAITKAINMIHSTYEGVR